MIDVGWAERYTIMKMQIMHTIAPARWTYYWSQIRYLSWQVVTGLLRLEVPQFAYGIHIEILLITISNIKMRENFNLPHFGLALSQFSPQTFNCYIWPPKVWTKMKSLGIVHLMISFQSKL